MRIIYLALDRWAEGKFRRQCPIVISDDVAQRFGIAGDSE